MAIGFNISDIINVQKRASLIMLDKISRIKDGRRIEPLDAFDNVFYPHRYLHGEYNLQIGDTYFMIPPEFIMVNSEAMSQSIVTLRQENTQKMKSGYHKRTILIDLVFNGIEQLNGYRVPGPESPDKDYYVDGLRQLLAQFKCTPFLPISNELINGTYGIFAVALQAITMSTVQGFPNVMTAQITLQEVNMFPYIEMPDVCFRYMIDWDLFRFYYQRFLTEDYVYKKLQSLPANKEHNRFKLSILDQSAFTAKEATKANWLEIICDIKKVRTDEEGNELPSNYVTWVDSDTSDVVISSFQCGYSNILTNIQMSDISTPTVQFIGGMDTIYNITFETTDYSIVQAIEQCQVTNDLLTRNNIKYSSVGFVKLESELVAFTGSLFVVIESVTTNTVPGFPGLYNVQMNCIAYDIAQSERESLHGFKPFACQKEECVHNDFYPIHVHNEQAIEQSMDGLLVKIKQDNYAEWKLRTNMEVYPDLHLPTYEEVNKFINRCTAFRKANGMTELPYTEYPTSPTCMLHGVNPENSINVSTSHGIAYMQDIPRENYEYNIYVDPDFYVFYPCSYLSFYEEDKDYYEYNPTERSSKTVTKTVVRKPKHNGKFANNLVEEFIALTRSFIGHSYVYGAEGEITDSKGKCFDCSGLITYALKEIGVMPANQGRLTVKTIPGHELFTEVPWSQMQRGDIICNAELDHVVIYQGNNTIVHASTDKPYPIGGVKEGNLYFKNGRCFRAKAFSEISDTDTANANTGETARQVWSIAKAYGLSDIAAAAILGNAQAESGVNPANLQGSYEKSLDFTDDSYTDAVNNGQYNNFVHDSAGYGLFQFTYWSLKQDLYNEAKSRGVSISNTKLQMDVMISQIKSSGVFDKINKALTVKEASNIFMLQYERPANQSVESQNKRAGYSQQFYDKFKGTDVSDNYHYNETYNELNPQQNTLTKDEFDSICRVIMAETKGETSNAEKAIAQVVYDRLTHPEKKFGGLSNILNSSNQFPTPYTGELNETVENNVRAVFCNNDKYWPDFQAWYFLDPDGTKATFRDREANYDRLDEVDRHVFWGKKNKGSDIKYTITDETGTSDTSGNFIEKIHTLIHKAKNITSADKFAEPVLAETNAIRYQDSGWKIWKDWDTKENAKEYLNDGENIFNTSFCDEYQYSCRGRLVRAFPTYLFCILDDNAQWFDGRKLWTNYYVHRSIVDIAVHGTNDMPTETATITITNSYHNLDRTQGGLDSYSIANDYGYNDFQRGFYKWSGGVLLGFGPKLTDKLIRLHQVIYDHAKLKDGARVHLRVGYGSDPLSLAPVMNGHVSDIALGDQITVVVTSDGHELIQHITSASEDDTNEGFLGLFGLFSDQESSNIIANIMCKRESWMTHLMGSTFEGSAYSIEHFGLYFNQTLMRVLAAEGEGILDHMENGIDTGGDIGEAIGLGIPIFSDITEFAGSLVGGVVGGVIGIGDTVLDLASTAIAELWNGDQEQYDILKNIYKADYSREHYIYSDFLVDGEQNVVFNQYNMTPWDVFQVCTQQVPEYILKTSYHQFDSRLYFGLPFWMEKYRYDYLGGKVYEECKASTQVHLLDCTNIIDNQVKVTSKFSNTNVKVMYSAGEDPVSTQTIHSDDTIDFAYQKTTILDTPIAQDALGPDRIYELLGYNVGEESARRVGISNLLYGWQQQYQGQIILMGCPGIKSHDYLLINDRFTNLYGLAIVREVTHSFNVNTGFTTSVTLGMIGFSTDENSGLVETCQNLLQALNCFSSAIETRRQLNNNYEQFLNIFSNFEILRDKVAVAAADSLRYKAEGFIVNSISKAGLIPFAIYNGVKYGKVTFSIAKNIKNVVKAGKLVKTYKTAYKAVKIATKGAKGIKAIIGTIKVGSIAAAGAPTAGIGSLVALVLWTLVDILLSEFFKWLDNKNVCVLLPLWWEEYPFVSGVKDGKNILLMDSNADATQEDENVGTISNTNKHWEDAPKFED